MSVVLSFDVGVIHLAYCLMTKKDFKDANGLIKNDWFILEWNNIDLTDRDTQKCYCGAAAKLSNEINGKTNYYCKTHGKKVNIPIKEFNEYFEPCEKVKTFSQAIDKKSNNFLSNEPCEKKLIVNKCQYISCSKKQCEKKASFNYKENKLNYICSTHAKQQYKSNIKLLQLKSFKIKNSATLDFDEIKFDLMMELENRPELLKADYVVIENQPSFKNPKMKSIATTIYDYYLIRGIIDKVKTNSNIKQVKFMSPSNKLKLANDGDTKLLIKTKTNKTNTNNDAAYKLTKSLGIKYCTELICHLENWQKHFNSYKKKDDLADAFLQGAYFYENKI